MFFDPPIGTTVTPSASRSRPRRAASASTASWSLRPSTSTTARDSTHRSFTVSRGGLPMSSAMWPHDEVDPALPQLRRVVVAHPLDQLEAGAGDQLGGAPAAALIDERVAVAVHHERRHLDRRGAGRPADPTLRPPGTGGSCRPGLNDRSKARSASARQRSSSANAGLPHTRRPVDPPLHVRLAVGRRRGGQQRPRLGCRLAVLGLARRSTSPTSSTGGGRGARWPSSGRSSRPSTDPSRGPARRRTRRARRGASRAMSERRGTIRRRRTMSTGRRRGCRSGRRGDPRAANISHHASW